jgi:glucan phosphoethanolaminetransferase (alkaline phosphatase superfamily)
VQTHAAALRYVDTHLQRLFNLFQNRAKTFVIACSDHGSCYGEDGYNFHCHSHEIVYTVPYMHFVL